MTKRDVSEVSRARRWMRRLAWTVAALLALWVLLWQGAPLLIKWQAEKIGTKKLGRPLRIGAVQLDPSLLGLTLREVSVGGAKAEEPPQLAVKRLYADLALESAWRLAPVLKAVQADAPALRLRYLGAGHYDVDDVLARFASAPAAPPQDEKPARFALHDIVVQGGSITFIDEPARRTHEVRDLGLALPFISNLPSRRTTHVTPQLAFTVDGSRFDVSAQALPFDPTLRTQAHLQLQRLDLAPYLAYQPASLPLRATKGAVDADLHLTFEEAPKPSLVIAGTVNLFDVAVSDAAGAPALAFGRLAVQAGEVRPLERVVHLTRVELTAPRVQASRDAQGRINWVPASAAAPKKTPAKPAANPSAAEDWRVSVDRLAITEGDVQWRDALPAPAATKIGPAAVRIAPFTFEAKNIAWPAAQPATFSGRMALADGTAQGAESAPFIAFEGQAQASAARLGVQARGLPLRVARPYLAAVLKPELTGSVDADAQVLWSAPKPGAGSAHGFTVEAGKLAFSRLALLGETGGKASDASGNARAAAPRHGRREDNLPQLPPGTLASIGALTLEGIKFDLTGRALALDTVAVQAPRLRMARGGDGRWMFEDWLALDAQTEHEAPGAKTPPWAVRVGHIALADGAIGWSDRQPAAGAVEVALAQLKLDVRDFDLAGAKPVPLELSALLAPRRGEPGKLHWRGAVGLTPVSVQGELDAERLPLQAFQPYVADRLNIDILRADTSFKGRVDYAQRNDGARLHVAGDARIEELRTVSHPGSAAAGDAAPDGGAPTPAQSANAALVPDGSAAASGGLGEELLSWKQLRVAGLGVRLDPGGAPQVEVRESQLSDFYARIIVHPNGRINLQDLVKTDASGASGADGASAAPVMHFGPTRLTHGRVAFSDHFIKPNYSADLTELDGALGAFSTVTDPQAPQMADLQLTGRAEGTAQLAISGKLNPLAHPLALDIVAKLTDLELSPLSPYAVKYSGHGIERGKLSMDVAYKIAPDGMLTAANKLVLNQLRFGEQVPGAPASLPVALATTLLADSNGVIDLDLPISGSLNDPEFSVGPVIFKAIVNLIGKAITAPFSLLGRALSGGTGGEDMSQVHFAPGSAALPEAAKAQLDKIAKALADRPTLKLTVVGVAQLDAEREALKRERLLALVAAERRAGAAAPAQPASAASASADEAQADEGDYAQLLRRLYRRADIPGKPRNFVGMTRDVPVAQMEELLLAQINVSEDDIRQLATRRAVAVKDYLLAAHLSAERVFVGAARIAAGPGQAASSAEPASAAAAAPASAPAQWTPHAELELSAQ